MAIYRVAESSLAKVPETTFEQENLLETRDLQRLIKADISVLSSDLLLIASEYGNWEDSSRRIDLLCLDKHSCLVVVELKRTEDGGHMELQAIRYAAMVSSMTFEQLVDAHARFLGGDEARARAESAILAFLGWESPTDGSLSDEVRILLVAADFSIELTTAVLWLNKRDLDITCIRLRPYRLDNGILIDIQQIIPLPEATEYETKIRVQRQENRKVLLSARNEIFRRFWAQLIERSRSKTALLANRGTSQEQWLSAGVGRSGFNLNFVLRQDESRVECYIDMGKDSDDRNLAAFRALLQLRSEIEAAFGSTLDWQELEESRACRICKVLEGGWKTPETEWPAFQDRLVDAMVRLEAALKNPIRNLKLPLDSGSSIT